MALDVNEQAWGNVAEWIKNTSTTGDYFTYPWSRRNWNNIYSQGHQTINQDIDLSIAPWRINKKSSLVDLMGNYWYNAAYNSEGTLINADDEGQAHHSIIEVIERKNVPFILSYIGGSGTSFPPLWSKYWAYKFDNSAVLKEDNNVGNRFPVANFRYDKIRICPVTWWSAADPENISTNRPTVTQVSGIYNADTVASNPYCVGIGFEIFIDKNGTWTEVPLTIDINTHFLGDGSTNDWYATEDGMFMMRMPYMYNPAGTHYNNMFFGQAQTWDMGASELERGDERAKIFMFSRASYDQTSTYGSGIMAGDFEGFRYNQKLIKKTGISIFSGYQYKMVTSYDDIRDIVMRELAYIGLPFTLTRAAISTASLDDSTLYLPVFDANRCTTGTWRTGAEARELPNSSWTWIYSIDPLPEDREDEDDDPKDYGDTTNMGTALHFPPNGCHVYLMDSTTYVNFLNELNDYYTGKSPDDWTIDFQGVNPSDYIISAYVTQLSLPRNDVGQSIKIGKISLNTNSYELSTASEYWCTFSYGTRRVTPYYEDFRDYEPYTSIELYLPLAGTIELETAYCMNHNITIQYYYDVLTMSGVAAVYRDNMLYKTADFSAGAQIPLLSSNMGSYQNQIEQLTTAQKQNNIRLTTSGAAAVAGLSTAIATGGVTAAIGATAGVASLINAVTQREQLDYQIEHTAPSISQTGTAENQNSLSIGQLIPKLIIKRPIMLPHDDAIYSKTVGNACCINAKIGSMHGKIVCSNIDTNGINATAEEINAIKQAFARGVIV